tara:strand:- start:2071 stop:2661 length:591 start_codon:yes stop_codon:yes gene_type:complete
MSFWTNSSVIPKRNFRFLIQFAAYGKIGAAGGDGQDSNDILWFAKNAKLPSVSFSDTEHNFLDNKYYYPGRATWEEVTMTLVDPASPDATKRTMQLLEDSGYVVKKASNEAARTISKNKATNSGVGSIKISILDDEGNALEVWTLNNAFVKSVSFSDLDYANEDLRTIDMSIRYDWATCEILKAGRTEVTPDTFFQ